MALETCLPWPLGITSLLNQIGIGTHGNTDTIHILAFNKMKDIFFQESFSEINKEGSKLRTYAKLKSEIGLEEYITSMANLDDRRSLSKLRLSSHGLMIEKGRHRKLPEKERLCPVCCKNEIENEIHFMIRCGVYTNLRKNFYTEVLKTLPNFMEFDDEKKLKSVLTNTIIMKHTGAFINQALEMRRVLLEGQECLEWGRVFLSFFFPL